MLVEVTQTDNHITTPRRRQRRLLCGLCRHVSDALGRTRSLDENGRDGGELRPCRAGRGAWRARVLTSTEVDVCGVLRTVPLGPVYRFRSLLFGAAVCEAPPPASDRVPSFGFAPSPRRRRSASALQLRGLVLVDVHPAAGLAGGVLHLVVVVVGGGPDFKVLIPMRPAG